MSCELTEKISLLIDGELSPVETRTIERHLQTCGECQQARTDFMQLRQQISAYTPALNAHAQQHALAAVLGKRGRTATRATRPTATTDAQRRPTRIFGVPALPFVVAALTTAAVALIVAGFAAFIIHQQRTSQSASTQANRSREQTTTNNQQLATTNENDKVNIAGAGEAGASGKQHNDSDEQQRAPLHAPKDNEQTLVAKNVLPVRANKRPVSSGNTTAQIINVSVPSELHVPELLPPQRAANAPSYITINASAPAPVRPVEAGTLAAQHVEQAGLLLRAFRNARTDEPDAASDLTYEKRRARQLLYQNIVLRREAASDGNVQLAALLDSLEPILIDIANLPDQPHADAVRAIRERIERKNLVALLEVNSTELARAYE
jgi:Putative zinc-finger